MKSSKFCASLILICFLKSMFCAYFDNSFPNFERPRPLGLQTRKFQQQKAQKGFAHLTDTHADMQPFHTKTSWFITENDFYNICLLIAHFHVLAANIVVDCQNYCRKGKLDPFMISSSEIFITDKISQWSKSLSTEYTPLQVVALLNTLEAVNKGTVDGEGKVWLTDYGMLPDFISNFLEEKLGHFFHSVSNTQSAQPTQNSVQTTPAKSPRAVQSPINSCRRSPRFNSPASMSENSAVQSKGASKQPYKSLRKKSVSCMVVSDPQSDSDAEAGDVEFGEEKQTPPVQVISAGQVEVPVQSLLKGSSSLLKDSLLSFDELLENIPECLQSQWSSKFVPTVTQVDIQHHPEDLKRFQECVIIHTDHLPNETQGAVILLSLVPFSSCISHLGLFPYFLST